MPSLTADNVIAISSVVIALAALVFSIHEGRATRRHNRLSVMPRVSVHHHLSGRQGMLGIAASNDGLGPAVVTDCVVEVDGTLMKNDGDNGWEAALTTLDLRRFQFAYRTIAPDGTIPIEGTVWLVSTPATPDKAGHPDIGLAFRRLNVRLSYESMYGDRRIAVYRS